MIACCPKCGSSIDSSTARCHPCDEHSATGASDLSLLLIVMVGLVLGVGVTVWGLHYWRTMHSGGNSIAITTPTGNEANVDLGVSVYFAAMPTTPDGQNHVIHVKKGNTDSETADFVTYDSANKVMQYYQNEMGSDAITKRGLMGTTVTLKHDSVVGTDNIVVTLIEYIPNHNTTLQKKTLIHIVHTRTAAAP